MFLQIENHPQIETNRAKTRSEQANAFGTVSDVRNAFSLCSSRPGILYFISFNQSYIEIKMILVGLYDSLF